MDTKSWYLSKTLWVNVIAVAAAFGAKQAGIQISAEDQVAALGVINLILRVVTKQPVAWS